MTDPVVPSPAPVPAPIALIPGRVSVIIPCYNVAALVHRALDSVLAQTYPDIEVVVVDDCSPDDLARALEPYQGRIVAHRHAANQGVSAARNTGAAQASGAILAFLDADDWWPPDLLEALAPHVRDGLAVCYDNVIVANPDAACAPDAPTLFSQANWTRARLDWDTMDALFHDAPIFKVLVTPADFERVGGYDTRFHGIEDFHFCVKLLARHVSLEMPPTPRGFYLVHAASAVRTHDREMAKQMQSITEWQAMSRAMPLELTLTPAAAQTCRRGDAYWSMRLADMRIRRCLREKQPAQMLSPRFLRDVLPSLPALAAHKAAALARKLRARILQGRRGARGA